MRCDAIMRRRLMRWMVIESSRVGPFHTYVSLPGIRFSTWNPEPTVGFRPNEEFVILRDAFDNQSTTSQLFLAKAKAKEDQECE
jgi:hypothetical protein